MKKIICILTLAAMVIVSCQPKTETVAVDLEMPWRNTYHVVKINDNWMILVMNISFIPKNEDIPKLNAALE